MMRNTLKKISAYVPSPWGRARVGVLFLLFPFTFYAQTNTFPASGNVGIGITNPGSPLYLRSGYDGIVTFQTSDNTWLYTSWKDNTGTRKTWMGLDRDLTSFNIAVENGVDKILFRGGNVGIGTINPGDWRLAVNGNIRAKEIKVETNWSDFVFEGDYNLPTLEEVEQHIKEKGHLKDIPSAKEVEENGIFLGEMDAKLLQKIEELTLYVLELKKENRQQHTRIDSLAEKTRKQQQEINQLKKK